MKRSLLEIYALLVCLGSIIWLSIVVCCLLWGIVQINDPELTINSYLLPPLDNNVYVSKICQFPQDKKAKCEEDMLSKEKEDYVTKRRLADSQEAFSKEMHEGKKSVLIHLIQFIISGILFAVHWRIAKHERIKQV